MINYTYTKTIKPDLLQTEIIQAGLDTIQYIDTVENDIFIYFSESLSEENESLLSSIVINHNITPPLEITIKNKILAAMDFGRNLMAEYGASNIILGLTMSQIQEIMAKTIKVQSALNTGSLYVALTELALVETDETVITVDRVTEFRNKIQTYLNIPLT